MSGCVRTDGTRTQMQEKMGLFNNKIKQRSTKNHPEGEKTARHADDCYTVKHNIQMT